MRAVVQRVKYSSVTVENRKVGQIGPGILVLLGVGEGDEKKDCDYLVSKILNLRIFEDEDNVMNLSVTDRGLGVLVVSQFTLYGDCRKGRRPSYDKAAHPSIAKELYDYFVEECKKEKSVHVEEGIFKAEMTVHIENDGPVTLLLDSKREF